MRGVAYAISTVVGTAQQQPRALAVIDADTFVCGAQDGTVQVWRRESSTVRDFTPASSATKVHDGIVFSVSVVPACSSLYPPQSIVTGGGDRNIHITSLDGEKLMTLVGHAAAVGSLAFAPGEAGRLLSGGWEGHTRVWEGAETVFEDSSHLYATQLLLLKSAEDGQTYLISVSANKEIHIYVYDAESSTAPLRLVTSIADAHSHVIRQIIPFAPAGHAALASGEIATADRFMTCGNDGYVKVWSLRGERLYGFAALLPGPDQAEFVYDIALLPEEQGAATRTVVTAGDDKTLRFYQVPSSLSGDAKEVHRVALPAPARALQLMPGSHDLVVACAAGLFVFTVNEARVALADDAAAFESVVASANKPKDAQGIDVASLPGVDALLQPPGAGKPKVVMVNENGKPMVYSWVEEAFEWQLQGEAVGTKPKTGKAPARKTPYNGREWDHVLPVEIAPGQPSLQLPFNVDEDPEDIAKRFLAQYSMSPEYMGEIVEFVQPLVDMDAVRARKEKAAAAEAKMRLYQTPSWSTGGYNVVVALKAKVLHDAILRRSDEFAAQPATAALALSAMEKGMLATAVACAEKATFVEPPSFGLGERDVVVKLLSWPAPQVVPCIDLLRACLCHSGANTLLANPVTADAAFVAVSQCLFVSMMDAAKPTAPTGQVVLALQAMSCWLAYRPLAACERSGPQRMPAPAVQLFFKFIADLAISALAAATPRIRDEAVKTLYNLAVHMGRAPGLATSPVHAIVFRALVSAVIAPPPGAAPAPEGDVLFQAVLTVASIGVAAPQLPAALDAAARADLVRLRAVCAQAPFAATQQVAHDLNVVYKLQ